MIFMFIVRPIYLRVGASLSGVIPVDSGMGPSLVMDFASRAYASGEA
jgi:hypothetical protein